MAYLLGFNNNIRCIEIQLYELDARGGTRFNNNIRCIEIMQSMADKNNALSFNNNIRCIEINATMFVTLTYDV